MRLMGIFCLDHLSRRSWTERHFIWQTENQANRTHLLFYSKTCYDCFSCSVSYLAWTASSQSMQQDVATSSALRTTLIIQTADQKVFLWSLLNDERFYSLIHSQNGWWRVPNSDWSSENNKCRRGITVQLWVCWVPVCCTSIYLTIVTGLKIQNIGKNEICPQGIKNEVSQGIIIYVVDLVNLTRF